MPLITVITIAAHYHQMRNCKLLNANTLPQKQLGFCFTPYSLAFSLLVYSHLFRGCWTALIIIIVRGKHGTKKFRNYKYYQKTSFSLVLLLLLLLLLVLKVLMRRRWQYTFNRQWRGTYNAAFFVFLGAFFLRLNTRKLSVPYS